MPNGYRRAPLPSPWRGAGAGLGSLLAGILMKPGREREEQEEQIREAYEQAKLTGDKSQLSKLREQYPKAIARFEREKGLTLPGVREVPEKQVEMPPFEPRPGVPMGISGAAVTMPGTETGPMPWPTTAPGMQVRDVSERMAGKPGLQALEKPTDVMGTAIRAANAAPEGEKQKVYSIFKQAHPELPDLKFTEKPPKPPTPPTYSEMMAIEDRWPDMDSAERALARERGVLPDRPPTGKGALKEEEEELPQPTFAQALKIAELTGESPPEIISQAAEGAYNYEPYLKAAAAKREVTELVMLIQRQRSIMSSYAPRKRKAARAELMKLTKDLADLLGFPYETGKDRDWIDRILDRFLREAPVSKFDKDIEGWNK